VATEPTASPLVVESEKLDIRLLGGLQIQVGGEPLEALRSGRARSLLAFLILHADVAHVRRRLAFEFWPDSTEAQARTNLRNVVHTVRRTHPALDASLEVTPNTLQWRPAVSATVDVDRFVAAAAAVADPDSTDDLIARCRGAIEAYVGDLLAGDYDEWLLPQREALRDRYRSVLRTLAIALIDDGQAGAATDVARDLVRVDPLDEVGHRLRIEAHHAAGDRVGAVRAYHECAATFERELGVEPGQATTAAYAAVLEGPRDETSVHSPPTVPARPGLVGREEEWRRLVAAWQAAEDGPPAVVLVTGEPGIGKTRLVDELRAWCARSGVAVGEARSYATEGDLGYGIVVSWLRSPDIRVRVDRLPPGQRAELARLLPELGSPGPVDGADDAERRRRLFDAATMALAGASKPTLLVADDCQWSDQVSQEFIHYLVRQRVGGPLLVALTARREELDAGHPMTGLLDALVALDRLTEVPLGRLSREATGEIGSQVAGSLLDVEAIETLFADTEGNPLFIVETVRSGWDGSADSGVLSPRLRAIIDARFHRLSEVAATVLGATAVVGRPCSANLLALLCDLDDRSLARGLDELWHRGILCETGTNSYEFSHGKLRDAAYENLSPATRRTHHGVVAQLLAELVGKDHEFASSQVAVHFEAANRPAEAIAWFQRAALDAQQVFAYSEAVRLLDRALALVPALPADVRHVRELELLSTLPVSLAAIDGYVTDRMRQAHRRAENVAASLGVELEPSFVRSMVMSALCRDEFADAADAAAQLLDHATVTGDASLRVESHYLLGISAFWAAKLQEARRHFDVVIADFDPSTRVRHHEVYGHDPQVVCLSRMANTLWFLGRENDARRTCEEALALAVEVGHPLSHDTAAIFSCLLAIDLGDHDRLRGWVRQLGALGMDSLPFATKREAVLGLVEALDGRHTQGIARTRAALDRCGGRNFYPCFQAAIVRVLLAIHSVAGDAEGGLETCARALDLGSTPLWDAEFHRARAEFLHATGAEAAELGGELRTAEAVARRQAAGGHLRRVEATRRRLGLAASPAPT
jgi:DNA-binding SARP family transcriptional activator/tetratricopeptide (TPR) repeat protein